MNSRTEVETIAGSETLTAPTRVKATPGIATPIAVADRAATSAKSAVSRDRLSVDPLSGTDRYRLVQPIRLPH